MQSHKWNSQSVDSFVKLVAQARAHNSKEVRLTMTDAQSLCDSICFLLLQERELTQALLKQMSQNTVSPAVSSLNVNGGSFS